MILNLCFSGSQYDPDRYITLGPNLSFSGLHYTGFSSLSVGSKMTLIHCTGFSLSFSCLKDDTSITLASTSLSVGSKMTLTPYRVSLPYAGVVKAKCFLAGHLPTPCKLTITHSNRTLLVAKTTHHITKDLGDVTRAHGGQCAMC